MKQSSPKWVAGDAEGRIVYALAGAAAGDVVDARIDERTRWAELVSLAVRENALVPLRDHCRRVPESFVPPEWRQRLAILSLDAERRMYAVRRRLEETLVTLNAAGIEPLLLKGAALASTVYGGWNQRAMRDIDLFVEPSKLRTVWDLALATAWQRDASVPVAEAYLGHHHLPPLIDGAGSGLRLEIHRSLLPAMHPFAFTPEEVMRSARRVQVGAGTALVMKPEHHLVHLAIHFVWSNLLHSGGWHACRDLGAIMRTGAVDWNELVQTAQRWRAATCVYWTLRLARALSGNAAPAAVLHNLRPMLPGFLLRRLERHFAGPLLTGRELCPSVRLERALWTAAVQPRLQGHGSVRPWVVSIVRDSSFQPQDMPAGRARRAGQTFAYLASLA